MVPRCSDRISRVPSYSISPRRGLRVQDSHFLWRAFPDASTDQRPGLRAVPRSLAATRGISVDFFSSGYLDVSVPRVCFLHPMDSGADVRRSGRVSPFGNPRLITLVCQLAEAYRRLPRPSSPFAAKASAVRTLSLDHITSSNLARGYMRIRYNFLGLISCQKTPRPKTKPNATLASGIGFRRPLVEPRRIELPTSCLQSRRSPG